ncbi:MAG: phosphatase PAP2 family protein [Arthrobacter sp.]|nr:phosphatase PAP2 family protein [Arthrobacter sp.]
MASQSTSAPPARPRPPRGFPRLSVPRHWVPASSVLALAALTLGLCIRLVPGLSGAELGVDQELSRHHEVFLTAVAMGLNTLFSPVAGVLIIAVVSGLLLVRRQVLRAVLFASAVSWGWGMSQVFKLIVARPRPNPALLLDPLAPETGSNSFPSGHTCLAVALVFAVCFLLQGTRRARLVVWAGAAVALVVAWSRLYIGVHYPTDVLASFLVTGAAMLAFTWLWNALVPRVLVLPLVSRVVRKVEGHG